MYLAKMYLTYRSTNSKINYSQHQKTCYEMYLMI